MAGLIAAPLLPNYQTSGGSPVDGQHGPMCLIGLVGLRQCRARSGQCRTLGSGLWTGFAPLIQLVSPVVLRLKVYLLCYCVLYKLRENTKTEALLRKYQKFTAGLAPAAIGASECFPLPQEWLVSRDCMVMSTQLT